jgi:hypothetical protein
MNQMPNVRPQTANHKSSKSLGFALPIKQENEPSTKSPSPQKSEAVEGNKKTE